MVKNKKIVLVLGVALSVLCFCACGEKEPDVTSASVSVTTSVPAKSDTSVVATVSEQEVPPAADDDYVKKAQYADDDSGIYAFAIVLNDTVPAKGLVEILFYGMNGDTETQVCCYEAEYERGDNGLYEIKRFYDGNVDVNDHQKQELKIPVTFGATVRATRVEATLIVNDSERIALYSVDIRK